MAHCHKSKNKTVEAKKTKKKEEGHTVILIYL